MPVQTCPGRTPACERACFGHLGHFLLPSVQERLKWAYRQSLRRDFVDRMTDECYRKGITTVRVHVVGDFATPLYTQKWVQIVAKSPATTFLAYTRSWRIPQIEPHLRDLASLPNVKLWYSIDRQSGFPEDKPPSVRTAYMQDSEEIDTRADLIFRVQRLRRTELPLVVPVCPHETREGKERGVTCSTCRICLR